MKQFLFIALAGIFSAVITKAQVPSVSKESVNSLAEPGKMITQFTDALKPSSFTDAWSGEKEGFLGKAQKVSNAAGMASTISTLAGFIKPSMFKSGTSAAGLTKTANTVKTMAQAANLLKTFEGGLKPEAFSEGWSSQRGAWLSALKLLQ